jgi:hypothetical protein
MAAARRGEANLRDGGRMNMHPKRNGRERYRKRNALSEPSAMSAIAPLVDTRIASV